MEQVILRQYIEPLFRNFWFIVLGTILAVLAALAYILFFTSPRYEATAGVLIARTRSQVTFDPRFQTYDSGDQIASYTNQSAHRATLVALVKNGEVAAQVFEQIGDQVGNGAQNPSNLLGRIRSRTIESTARDGGDLIEIIATHGDPTMAALLANTWADVYVTYINDLYSKQVDSYASVEQQIQDLQGTYLQTEQNLQSFLADSRTSELTFAISSTLQTIQTQTVDDRDSLAILYSTKRKMEQLLQDARGLQAQIQNGGEDASGANGLALLLLKAETFATSSELPGSLEIQLPPAEGLVAGASVQAADVASLIAVVEARIADLETAIDEQLAAPASESRNELYERLSDLQAELEKEQAKLTELTRARDLAWDTYSTLNLKLAELGIEQEMADVEVVFASPALEPAGPTGASRTQFILVGAGLGFLVSAALILFLNLLLPGINIWAELQARLRRTHVSPPAT